MNEDVSLRLQALSQVGIGNCHLEMEDLHRVVHEQPA